MAYNAINKLRGNLRAIGIAIDFQKGKALSVNDMALLMEYSGFGGIKAILYPDAPIEEWTANGASNEDLKLHSDILALHSLLKEHYPAEEYRQVISSLKNSVLTAFYTPEIVPKVLYDILGQQGIQPKRLYDPSAGSGVFVAKAVEAFPELENVTAVEKDTITGLILKAINSSLPVRAVTHISGLEDTPEKENGQFDLVASNIPFGNFSVYDEAYPDKELSGKIHNYFFAKGLDKTAEGGLLAYITTDGFLNSPSNITARRHLFDRADFISLAVMPDNLMKESGNTEAPSHLLIVQKRTGKSSLSNDEQLLLGTDKLYNEFGQYYQNLYIQEHSEIIIGTEIKGGTNQYGQAHETVWQHGDIDGISERLEEILSRDFARNFDKALYQKSQAVSVAPDKEQGKKLTYLPMPESRQEAMSVQLGLFDTAPAENIGRAMAYITELDQTVVQKETAKIIGTISTTDNPGHECIVVLASKYKKSGNYLFKLHSNVKEIDGFSANWMKGGLLAHELEGLKAKLESYDHTFKYEGDQTLSEYFAFHKEGRQPFQEFKTFYSEDMLVIHQGKAGRITNLDWDYRQADFQPLLDQGNRLFYEKYTTLRDKYLLLSAAELAGRPAENSDRNALESEYESFTAKYGLLNAADNRKKILEDRAFGIALISSLERREGERFVKADILTQSIVQKKERFSTDDPIEALAHSLNDRGRVDMEFISVSMGLSEQQAVHQLGNHIYLNAGSNSWETADEYLSGNVVEKLRLAQRSCELDPDSSELQRSLAALLKVQPERIPFELLDFNLGERWMPTEFYEEFASQLFEQATEIGYFSSLDTFKVSTGHNMKVDREFAVSPKSGRTTYGYTLLEHALENTTPFFTYEVSVGDGKTIRLPDNDAIQLAHQKIEQMRSGFVEYLQQLPDEKKKQIENLYNETFNCYVLREFDGSHLTFPGLDKKALGIEDLYGSQKNAVWRIIQNGGALVDHEVGLGKTLTMIVAAQEMKRLGIINKPIILALKANVGDIAQTYRKAYPNARVLYPGNDDFTPSKRVRLLHEIKNNNWDCVILTHDQFGKIPQSPEIQKRIFQSELDNVERDLETASELGESISKKVLKGLEIRKNNLDGKLKSVLKSIEEKKDTGINFKELGLDHVFVDESHKFKNLTFTTRHNRVAGLGNMEGSQKALNMLFAVRTLQEKFDADLCATFLSGTPISNSLTEMYLIFKYLRPKEMERQKIENFDAWAAVFAKKTTDFEFSVTNEIVAKERFRHFIKVPELALFYNEITDYKTAKHISLDKPELDEVLVNIPLTPDQQQFTKELMAFARTGNASLIGRPPLSPSEDKARMLIATNYAKKMAVDMRLVDDSYPDHPDNKVNVCARNVAELYRESTPHKGTQIIFCDIGTPNTSGFNLYDAMRDKLVSDFGIPRNEIAFIHDWQDKRKPELCRKMNIGEMRILLGSTEMAGTGLNVQRKVVATHHLDIPWTPKDLEQRNGRGARQGNVVAKEFYGNKVRNFIYGKENSLDNYKFNLLKNKQTFIAQMKNCELNVRTIDEGAFDEKSGMNFSEYIAILSGDNSLLEKSKLEKKVAVMESLKAAHFREVSRSRYALEYKVADRKNDREVLKKLRKDEAVHQKHIQYDKDGIKSNPIRMAGLNSTDPEKIGGHIIELYKRWKPPDDEQIEQKVGSLNGFDLYIRRQRESYESGGRVEYRINNSFYAQSSESDIKYTYNNGIPNIDNPKLASRHFLNAIDRVVSLREKYERSLKLLDSEIPKLEELAARPFLKEAELQKMKIELSGLEREISLKIQENQLKEQQQNGISAETEAAAEPKPVVRLSDGERTYQKSRMRL